MQLICVLTKSCKTHLVKCCEIWICDKKKETWGLIVFTWDFGLQYRSCSQTKIIMVNPINSRYKLFGVHCTKLVLGERSDPSLVSLILNQVTYYYYRLSLFLRKKKYNNNNYIFKDVRYATWYLMNKRSEWISNNRLWYFPVIYI